MDTYENDNQGFEPVHIPPEPVIPAGPEISAEPIVTETVMQTEQIFTPEEPVSAPVQQEKDVAADFPETRTASAEQTIKTGFTIPNDSSERPREKKSGLKGLKTAALIAAFAILLGVAAGSVVSVFKVNKNWENEMKLLSDSMNNKIAVLEERLEAVGDGGISVSGSPAAVAEGLTPGQVYAQNKMSVVAISCSTTVSQFGQSGTATSSGSGFVLTEDGYVVTNYHVVEGADSVNVITFDGKEYAAAVKGYDANNDLAVLKVEAQGLQAVKLGSSSDLIIGDMVVAIGNPLGELTSTQTVGYVSGKDRDVATDGSLINMLQTDAAINPGNSGGPLFNMKGEVIGITTAKYSGTTSSGASIEGIGFAIPIDDVTKMIDDIMVHGYVTGAYLGVMVSDLTDEMASYYGKGAAVVEVQEGYCAERAGIRPNDLIIDLGGYKVESVATLTRALRNFEAGDITTVTVLRNGREVVMSITLDEKPNMDQTVPDTDEEIPMPSEGSYEEWYEYFYRHFYGKDPDQQP